MKSHLPPFSDDIISFEIPPELQASEPSEARGINRDQVKLMVSYCSDNLVEHTQFSEIGKYLLSGDILVINTSATLNSSIPVSRQDGTSVQLNLCTQLPSDLWIVEIAEPGGQVTTTFPNVTSGEILMLPQGGMATLHVPYRPDQRSSFTPLGTIRLWIATFTLPMNLYSYLETYGMPNRYSHVKEQWPSSYYQTVYATEPGSAEMPSAGRAFTAELLTKLMAQGVYVAPLVLHTGVSSLRNDEPLYEEFYRIPLATSQLINSARMSGQRIIAVGTTVLRALETVTDSAGIVHPGEGWTRLTITPNYKIRVANGFLTGLHEFSSSHMFILTAFAGRQHVHLSYNEAIEKKYLWHEFGDMHLILR